MTQPDSLAAIIAEMREPENSGQFGPWQITAASIKDWADRLAALAGAAPVAFPRVETGVIQFGDDWPGVFIRGDNALATAMHLRCEEAVWRNAAVKAMAELLEGCNVANTPDVRRIPVAPHAPAKAREDDARRVLEWLASEDTGMSSESIAYHMLGMYSEGSHPHDPADLGRCLRLLELFPEWKARIREMATYSRNWAALSARWEELAVIMDAEVGIDWSKGRNAPRTYEAMKAAMRAALATFAEGAE